MSIARIGETRAKEGQQEALRNFLLSIVPTILSSAGCLSCDLFQDQEDPVKFIMVEVWESVEAHQASVKDIPPEMIREIMPLLAASPAGSYFDALSRAGGGNGS